MTEARPRTPSPAALSVLMALLEARTGQQIAPDRSWRIDTALQPVMRQRGCDTFDQLVAQLLDGQDRMVGDQIVDALINQETSFFRDAAVIDQVLDAVTAAEADGRRARVWCAGCSTGQEPLSLAMLFAERGQKTGARSPEIVATDVSEGALARARTGRFNRFEIQRGLPIRRMMSWFEAAGADWQASPELLRQITFRRQNLVADTPPAGRFDAILCRNVLLYFSAATKAAVLDRFADVLRPDGVLVLGAGETTIGHTRRFEPSLRFRGLYERARAEQGRSAA